MHYGVLLFYPCFRSRNLQVTFIEKQGDPTHCSILGGEGYP